MDSSAAHSLSTWDLHGVQSHSEIRAAAYVQPSSLGAATAVSVSCLPLHAVMAAPSTVTSHRGCFPSTASSRHGSRSRSPVYRGHASSSRGHSRIQRSASVASSLGGVTQGDV